MITVCGKVVRVKGKGLVRFDDTKSEAGKRTIPLPRFAISALVARRQLPFLGKQPMIFPSTEARYGTLAASAAFGAGSGRISARPR
jgi:hypothetical protein